MKKIVFMIIIVATLLGCNNNNQKHVNSLIKIQDEEIGAFSKTDDYIYYASYDMEKMNILPNKTRIMRVKPTNESVPEMIYEFEKPVNVSYMKCIDDKIVMNINKEFGDEICILENGSLTEIENSSDSVIAPSYSGDFVSWVDFENSKLCYLDLDKKTVKKVTIENICMDRYERVFNFHNKSYLFKKGDNENSYKLISYDWSNNMEEDVLHEDIIAKRNEKPSDVGVSENYIKWEVRTRRNSILYVYNRKNNEIKNYESMFSNVKHSLLCENQIFVFTDKGKTGIEILDLKSNEKKEFVAPTSDEIYSPYPYWIKNGFITEAECNGGLTKYFLISEEK